MVLFTNFRFSRYIGITIFPFVIINKKYKGNEIILNHEQIHRKQQLELLVIPFFIITLAIMFAVDLTKIHFASKLKRHMTPKILSIIGISIGAIMITAGIIIMFQKIEFNIPTH